MSVAGTFAWQRQRSKPRAAPFALGRGLTLKRPLSTLLKIDFYRVEVATAADFLLASAE